MSGAASLDELGLVGSTVDGVRYDACVDAGGFGLVYRCTWFSDGKMTPVAVKCLKLPHATRSNPELRASVQGRFLDESRILFRLSQGHRDIVRYLGSGTLTAPSTGEGTPYMILEWLDGRTLSNELRERRARNVPGRSLEAAVALLDSAVSALAYAHAHEVVHRDVKPGNLFMANTPEGMRLKVLDFGLAKILADDVIGMKPSVETATGVHFCSPSYGAPEQFSPKVGPVGPWTDVYALTLVLLELLTGKKVRQASTLADGALQALDPAKGSPSPASLGLALPPPVEALLTRAVAQNPLERPRDAGIFWKSLQEARAGRAVAVDLGRTVMDGGIETEMDRIRDARVRAQASARAADTGLGGTVAMAPPRGLTSTVRMAAMTQSAPPPPMPPPTPGAPFSPPPQLSPHASAPPPPMAPLYTSAPPPRPISSAPPRAPGPGVLPAGVPAPGLPAWLLAALVAVVAALLASGGYALWLARR